MRASGPAEPVGASLNYHVAPMSSVQYRPAIDGLRAVAVLAVFFFHLNNGWLPGGFVGVDVFFVISGYLITSILLRDHERQAFSLAKFYQRRIARLFPAFLTAAVATLAPPSSPKVRRALAYLEQHPDATANDAACSLGGRRTDALAAVRAARRMMGTNGNQFPRHASGGPTSDLPRTLRERVRHERAS